MDYDEFESVKLIAQGDSAVEVVHGAGHAKASGRRFESDIARIWTIRDAARSFYDTYSYVSALHGS